MKTINKYYFFLIIFLSNAVYARNIESSINKFVSILSKITLGMGSIGLLIAASGFIMGKNDAGPNLQKVVFGIGIGATAVVINQTIKSIA